jgi:hypothetical protein
MQKALVVSEIEIDFSAVVEHKDFAVVEGPLSLRYYLS